MLHGSLETADWSKSTSGQIQDGGLGPNCTRLNRYNSAADCSICLKFGKWVRYKSVHRD